MNSLDTGHTRRDHSVALDPAAVYRAAALSADVGIVVQSMQGIVLWCNPAYGRILGYDPYELVGLHPLTYALPPEDRLTDEQIAQYRYEKPKNGRPWIEVARNVRSDGSIFWIEMSVSFTKFRGYGDVAILVARDITDHVERRQQIEKNAADLRRLALTDSLTGLANRYALMQTVYEIWDDKYPNRNPISILYVDVDRLRQINDKYGQSAGDHVLMAIGKRLQERMGPGDVIARAGGGEFIVLCRSVMTERDLSDFATTLLKTAEEPIHYKSAAITPTLSVGAAISPPEGLGPETLLKRANFALKNAKDLGSGRAAIYDLDLHNHRTEQDILAEELRDAITKNQLCFYFQPVISLETGLAVGLETLVRWNNPRLGLLSPDHFLPLARQIGVMADIDLAALDAALKLVCVLKEAGYGHIRAGINGSAEFLAIDNFARKFFTALDRYEVEPRSIVFEVLETVIFDDLTQSNSLAQVVQTLHDCGVTVLLDDFGTGHAGLTHLAKLAVSGIKIDRSLTENILTDRTSAKIVGMMYDLCKDLGFTVVTEGIETTEQAQRLMTIGGTSIQGYWIAKPMPAADVLPWISAQPDWVQKIGRSAIAATH